MLGLIERGLHAPAEEAPTYSPAPAGLPSIRLDSPLNLPRPSNAALFELLDD